MQYFTVIQSWVLDLYMKAYGMDDMEGISKFGFFFFFLHLNLEWANVLVLGWHSVTVIEKTIVSKGYFIENSI